MSQPVSYPRVAALKTAPQFLARLDALGVALPFDEQIASGDGSPLAQATEAGGLAPRNRFCILPMEGWDGTADGRPSDLTRRRWGSFGRSGAALIWGGEAFAVRHDGRPSAVPSQPSIGRMQNRLRGARPPASVACASGEPSPDATCSSNGSATPSASSRARNCGAVFRAATRG